MLRGIVCGSVSGTDLRRDDEIRDRPPRLGARRRRRTGPDRLRQWWRGRRWKDPSKATPVTVQAGFIPVIDVAALYLGEKHGFFANRGIKLNIHTAQGGAALVPPWSAVSTSSPSATSSRYWPLAPRDCR